MDKFNIFGLLNNLFSLYKESLSKKDTESTTDYAFTENSFSQPPVLANSNKNPSPAPNPSPVYDRPLQAGMLSTLKTHDEFVKRVYQKNKPTE